MDPKSYYSSEDLRKDDGDRSSGGNLYKGIILVSTVISLIIAIVSLGFIIDNRINIQSLDPLRSLEDSYLVLIKEKSETINQDIQEGIFPRLNLITASTTTTIPRSIAIQTKDLSDLIKNRCYPSVANNDTSCDVLAGAIHSNSFSQLDPSTYWTCSSGSPTMNQTVKLLPDNSQIPGSTYSTGCVRIPTFSLGSMIYSYSHNIIYDGCNDHSKSSQYWQLGYISTGENGEPLQQVSRTLTLNNGLNRKSCSTVAQGRGAYLLCTNVIEDERTDYSTEGIQDLILDYIDIFGAERSYRYTNSEVDLDRPYAALYPSVGSGTVYNDRILFLGYGGLMTPYGDQAMCQAPECTSATQDDCNSNQLIGYFSGRQIVNCIIEIITVGTEKPIIRVRTIPNSQVWLGAEGRIQTLGGVLYLYIRSAGWHALAQTGIILTLDPIRISWIENTGYSRPGNTPCPASSRCPAQCITGVYTDIFPLSQNYGYLATVTLLSGINRVNPVISYGTSTGRVADSQLTDSSQVAAYTTTTCFTFNQKGYCYHIIELSPATLGIFQPVLVVTEIPKTCS
uniref:Hemagglutinin-neuraminidase protein HN n=1 Tax=Anaconda paramyxovirus TaxID=1529450 RepID=A0A1W6AMM1_9MONO|nr:hemagglutinin-neuraminidase protein HN [Anaconda paramyxovirus]